MMSHDLRKYDYVLKKDKKLPLNKSKKNKTIKRSEYERILEYLRGEDMEKFLKNEFRKH